MATETRPGDLIHTDGNDKPLRISREIPLPWLVGLLFVFAGQAIAIYYGQQEHARLLVQQGRSLEALSNRVDGSAAAMGTVNVAVVKHELQIDGLRERIGVMESEFRKVGTK